MFEQLAGLKATDLNTCLCTRLFFAVCELERLARYHTKGHVINQKPGLLMGTSNFIVFISFLPDSSLDGSSSGYSLPNWRVNEAIVLRLVVEEYTMFMSEPNGRVLLIWMMRGRTAASASAYDKNGPTRAQCLGHIIHGDHVVRVR